MSSTENDSDPVLDVLTEYERKLRALQLTNQLEGRGAQVFERLALDLERRAGGDRRGSARGRGDRRQLPRPPAPPEGDTHL